MNKVWAMWGLVFVSTLAMRHLGAWYMVGCVGVLILLSLIGPSKRAIR